MPFQTSTNQYQTSKYMVDADAIDSPYNTVQSAIDAANTAGGGLVVIREGTFTEDLTLYDNIVLQGLDQETIIRGVHTPPAAGTISITNLTLTSPTDIIESAVAGTAEITMTHCIVNCDNGYVYDLVNWTGTLELLDVLDESTICGVVNNTGGSNVNIFNSGLGAGANVLTKTGGELAIFNSRMLCAITTGGACVVNAIMGSSFENTITLGGTTTGNFNNCSIITGANQAIVQNSANSVSFTDLTIDCSNDPVIGGTGTVQMGGVSFLDGKNVAATVTQDFESSVGRVTPYTVGTYGNFSTIQTAIDAAVTTGADQTVMVSAGTYTENLVLYDGINIVGATGLGDEGQVEIDGIHTPPATGNVVIRNFRLSSATDIFSSAVAGTAHLVVIDCAVECTNGYLFNLLNWAPAGILEMFDINSASGTADGGINNTGGCQVYIFNAGIGVGNGNNMTLSGATIIFGADIGCPVTCQGTGVTTIDGGIFPYTVTTAATNTVNITTSRLATGANAAITHASGSVMELSDVTIDSAHATPIGGTGTINFGSVTFLDESAIAGTVTETLTSILKTGEVHAENIQNSDCSGIEAWGGAGVYYSLAATDLTIERAGSGYVRGKLVNWLGGQATGALAISNTHFIYMDEDGAIGTTTTRSFALFRDNIVLFEVLVDPNSVVTVVREDHPYNFSTAVSDWAHDTIGTVIANLDQGANITLNGTKGIQINGADELEDHGLETDIPDSAAAAVNFTFMFTNGAGKWEIDSTANTFASEYNNAGVVAALGANKYGIFRLYVSKDDLNTATPVYYAVLHTAFYNNLTLAQTAVALGTPARATNELAQLEMAQLGFVIKEESSDNIVDVIIEKSVGGGSTSLVSPGVASLVTTDTTNFNGWLGAGDTTVQAALETLDDVGLTVTPEHSVLLAGATLAIASTGVLTDGQLVIGSTGLAPAVAALASADGSVVITNGAGTINLSAAGGGILAWTAVTGATQAAAVDQGYITNRGGGVDYTLPDTAALGSVIRIAGLAGLWTISQNAGESIVFGAFTTTVGVGGSLVATNAGDAIEILCTVADTTWTVLSSIGNITVN